MSMKILPVVAVAAVFAGLSLREHGVAGAAERIADRLPTIGTIKDYPATGLMTGCGNTYAHFASDVKKGDAAYVFLCGAEGDNAWMNLNGRDTRLKLLSAKVAEERDGPPFRWRSEYAAGEIRITIDTTSRESDDDFTSAMKITVTAGKQTQVVDALAYSDC
jgi:hypothetical protein